MPKSQKEETLSTLASRIFSVLLDDLVMDITLQSHHETARSRSVCSVCKTRCSSVHAPGPSQVASQSAPSRPSTPAANGASGTGTSTPTSTKADGNLYMECVNCSRQVASNRYAPHLSSCLGLSTSRRGAARGSAVKLSTHPSEAGGRSTGSPEASDDGSPTKGKGKSKAKNDADTNLKRKRPESPQMTPNKKQKKQNSGGSPVSRLKSVSDISGVPSSTLHSPSTSSHSKVPSKLRDSSTASLVGRSATPSSGFSSPAPESPQSSPYSIRSPSLARNHKPNKALDIIPPERSPPRQFVDDYLFDDGGDETGSSTDTDSS
ncbi:hypothetical protein R3P38DRAFT_2824306 [Favolaschia claudopus]|uniref:SAGA-associated factor 11 n=1 Tax=Favolaschia claudopus TaxID=2862362 RepID=A0AAW0EGH6_9AGAR